MNAPAQLPRFVADAKRRRIQGMAMQAIEGNPLDDADIAMFEMFEREGWTHERRRAYLDQMFVEARQDRVG
jgi:hypothetical protein